MQKKPRAIIGWTLAAVWLLTQPAAAVEYRFQVTNLDYLTFSSYLEPDAPARRGEEAMRRLEASLDTMAFPTNAVLPGRQVQMLEDPGYGGQPPARLALLPATGTQAWTTLVWEGNPGDTIALVIRSEMRAWQEVVEVAANPGGGLRRLSIGGPGFFGRQGRQVPDVPADFLINAVAQGTFTRWLEQRAKALNGMSIVVGRGRGWTADQDRVYVVLTLPPEPRTFKLVIGWRNLRRTGNGS